MKACKTLHELGALSDYLLIDPDDRDDSMQDFSDSEDSDGKRIRIVLLLDSLLGVVHVLIIGCIMCADEGSRKELHEMLVPDAIKESWSETESTVCLHSYYIKFSPNPVDRDYKKFGLFVKAALPRDAESMRLDIHLARGRSIMTVLFPHGVVKFDANEVW